MKQRLITTITSALATAALGLTIGLMASAGSTHTTLDAATAPAAGAAAPEYVMLNCDFKAVVRPSSYVLACADDGMGLVHMQWTSWTAHLASGYGTFYENDCTPSCASGHFHYYSVIVTAWGSAGVTGHPSERRYTELTLTFPGTSRPPVYVLVNGKVVATHPVTQVLPAI
jgi:hypothetical protein